MYKWQVFYSNQTEGKSKTFTVKANSKAQAIDKAVEKIEKTFSITDRLLNHYSITLQTN